MINTRSFYIGGRKFNYDWSHLVDEYKRYCTKDSIVVEVGGSVFERTKELSLYCKKVIAVELMPERIPDKKEDKIEYRAGNWEQLSEVIEPESVDIVISSHCLEHVKDDLSALNETFKVLKKNGAALINTPNRKRLTRAIIEFFTRERKFPYWEHQREYTKDNLLDLAERSLFKNSKVQVNSLVFGLHSGYFFIYLKNCPEFLIKKANYLELILFK